MRNDRPSVCSSMLMVSLGACIWIKTREKDEKMIHSSFLTVAGVVAAVIALLMCCQGR